jgi:glutamine cyclotransferase
MNAHSKFMIWFILAWMMSAAGGALAMPVEPIWPGLSHPPALVEMPGDVITPPPVYGYQVLSIYPHDAQAFTQGLVYWQDGFYEGTGLHGRSSLRRVDLKTGQIANVLNLPAQYFGEGVAMVDDRLYQLTWQSHVGFIYDRASFRLLGRFQYPTEGWGLTYNGQELIMSDGSPMLYFLDPKTMKPVRTLLVHDDSGPVAKLNELEYIDGEIYANVWQTDRIARIDPLSGWVLAWIDLRGLLPPADRLGADVLNGIAWDEENRRLFVTGKLWPKLFQIELLPPKHVSN